MYGYTIYFLLANIHFFSYIQEVWCIFNILIWVEFASGQIVQIGCRKDS